MCLSLWWCGRLTEDILLGDPAASPDVVRRSVQLSLVLPENPLRHSEESLEENLVILWRHVFSSGNGTQAKIDDTGRACPGEPRLEVLR